MKLKAFFIFLGLQALTNLTSYSQDTLTVGEVYNFEIGDEFHFETSFSHLLGFGVRRLFIDDKKISDNEDTIFYKGRMNFYSAFEQVGEMGEWQDYEVKYSNLDSTLNWNNACVNIDTCILEFDFDSLCSRATMTINRRSGLIDFEENRKTLGFGVGLGQILDAEQIDDGNMNVTERLVYYKKANGECGYPNFTSGITNKNETQINIYPNPAKSEICISSSEYNGTEFQLKVSSLDGKVLHSLNSFVIGNKLNIDLLRPGIYILSLEHRAKRSSNKIIVF